MMNLQATPIDQICDLIIHEKIDKVMEMVMRKLEIPIPEFRRSLRLKLSLENNNQKMLLTGIDTNGDCYVLFKMLKVTGLGPSAVTLPRRAADKQPYEQAVTAQAKNVKIVCEFQGHYNEPKLELSIPMDKLREHGSLEFEMVFHVPTEQFEIVRILKAENREFLENAKFTVTAVPKRESSAARPAAANNRSTSPAAPARNLSGARAPVSRGGVGGVAAQNRVGRGRGAAGRR